MQILMNLDAKHLREFTQNVELVWEPTALIKTSLCLPFGARIEFCSKQRQALK
jgi:hypothetical protein